MPQYSTSSVARHAAARLCGFHYRYGERRHFVQPWVCGRRAGRRPWCVLLYAIYKALVGAWLTYTLVDMFHFALSKPTPNLKRDISYATNFTFLLLTLHSYYSLALVLCYHLSAWRHERRSRRNDRGSKSRLAGLPVSRYSREVYSLPVSANGDTEPAPMIAPATNNNNSQPAVVTIEGGSLPRVSYSEYLLRCGDEEDKEQEGISCVYQVYWLLTTFVHPLTLLSTVMFWPAVHLTRDDIDVWYLPLATHGLNSIYVVVDVLISQQPYKFFHFLPSVGFMAAYSIYTLMYEMYVGDVPLYEQVLNWQDTPYKNVVLFAVAILASIVCYLFLWMLAKVRDQIITSCRPMCGRGRESNLDIAAAASEFQYNHALEHFAATVNGE